MSSLHPISFLVEGFRIARIDACEAPDGGPAVGFLFMDGCRLVVYADQTNPLRVSIDVEFPTRSKAP